MLQKCIFQIVTELLVNVFINRGFPKCKLNHIYSYFSVVNMDQCFKNILVVIVIIIFFNMLKNSGSESKNYIQKRETVLNKEKITFIGGELNLTSKENTVNKVILNLKKTELVSGYENVLNFLPSLHIFDAKEMIKKSELFLLMQKIPKGGSLHTHLLAGVSIDYIIKKITYRDNIYGGYRNGVFKLIFFAHGDPNITPEWKKLDEYRKNDPNFDKWLKDQLSLEVTNPSKVYPTSDAIWTKLKKTFTTQYDMVCYKPVFEDYIYQLLNELYLDNVMYTELRGTLMTLYDLNGIKYNNEDYFRIFIEVVEKFKNDHPNFIGVRFIHNLYRGVSPAELETSLQELLNLKRKFPDFISGFDFVGHEEEGHRLFDFHEVLLKFNNDLNFYFHAGETNWFGHTDINLLDAILLNSSRIGHGFGLNKHPVMTELAREKNICVELCPISNQVLKLVDDHRNHPMISLMATGFPVVICNDDPAVWGVTGLSFDWYVTFMSMTPESAGLETLKQFAINSILYSSMDDEEKAKAIEKWKIEWDIFLDYVISTYNNRM